MGLAELVLLAIGLSMDAFAVSICKGLGMKKINLKVAAVLGLFFGGFPAGMPVTAKSENPSPCRKYRTQPDISPGRTNRKYPAREGRSGRLRRFPARIFVLMKKILYFA